MSNSSSHLLWNPAWVFTRVFTCVFSWAKSRAIAWILAVLSAPGVAWSSEKLGVLEIHDLLLEPQFYYTEPATGRFESGNSLVSVRWIRDAQISGVMTFGTRTLLGSPAWYGRLADDQEIGLIEGFAQGDTTLGQVRLGLVPISFGTEGGARERQLQFPRSLLFRERLVGLRDYGLTYWVENSGYFSEWAVHNGESGRDLDNKAWFTARWGWRGSGITAGVSGTTGRTTPLSTNSAGTNTDAAAGMIVEENAKIRLGNVFFAFDGRRFETAVDWTEGEILQVSRKTRLSTGHADLVYYPWPTFGALARYDRFEPNRSQGDDRIQEATIGLTYRSRYETSVFYLYGTKVFQEGRSPDIHQFRVVWRLTPYVSTQ